jgi:hypothetical protein
MLICQQDVVALTPNWYCVALDKGPFYMQAIAVRTDGVAASADLNFILEFLFFQGK